MVEPMVGVYVRKMSNDQNYDILGFFILLITNIVSALLKKIVILNICFEEGKVLNYKLLLL